MEKVFLVEALLLSAGLAFGQTTRQKWTVGWGIFNEPPN
jgi:hypothetical protein